MPEPLREVFWLDGLRAGSDGEVESTALAVLNAATALASAGNWQSARQLCATVVFQAQPLITTRPKLLRATMYVLLMARGFSLMSYIVRSMSGRGTNVTVGQSETTAVEPPLRYSDPRRMTLVLDPQWLNRLSPDDVFLERWCDELIPGERADPVLAGRAAQALHFGAI